MNTYIGWLFVTHPWGAIGFLVVPEREAERWPLPESVLTKHTIHSVNLADATKHMAGVAAAVMPGLNRHTFLGGS